MAGNSKCWVSHWIVTVPAVVAMAFACGGSARAQASHPVVRLWEGKAPGDRGPMEAETPGGDLTDESKPVAKVTNVTDPTLTVYLAPKEHATHAAVIIAPGGGYRFLSWDLEGREVARKYNEHGVSAFILKYRVPLAANDPGAKLPLMDGQRAVSLVRARAAEWDLDPKKIGFLGFSAGGDLAAKVSNQSEHRAYAAADAIDQVSCRPDFAVLIYPGIVLDSSRPGGLPEGMTPTSQTPPTFLAVAADDKGCEPCTVRYFEAALAAGVLTELHVYLNDGHGFGLRTARVGATATWPERSIDWMETVGIIQAIK